MSMPRIARPSVTILFLFLASGSVGLATETPETCSSGTYNTYEYWLMLHAKFTRSKNILRDGTYGGHPGNYTLTVTADGSDGTTTQLLQVSATGVTSRRTHSFSLASRTTVSVALTGLNADFDCQVGNELCTNRGGRQDDGWSGELGPGAHSIAVYILGDGRHGWWRGELWGRQVVLQTHPAVTSYDLYVVKPTLLEYWGTFRGNNWEHPLSHSFDSPITWMNKCMAVDASLQNSFTVRALDNQKRKNSSTSTGLIMRVEILEHLSSFTIPEQGGATLEDVLKIRFWPDYSGAPNAHETYHLARGFGTVYFVTANEGEPSGVERSWAYCLPDDTTDPATEVCLWDETETVSPPTIPWFDPFHNMTAVWNGFFDDYDHDVDGAAIGSENVPGWTSTSNDAVMTRTGPQRDGVWQAALRGSSGGGDSIADAAVTDAIPVSGGTY